MIDRHIHSRYVSSKEKYNQTIKDIKNSIKIIKDAFKSIISR